MNKISTFIKSSIVSLVAAVGFMSSAVSANTIDNESQVTVSYSEDTSILSAYLDNSARLLSELPSVLFSGDVNGLLASVDNPFGIDTRIKTDAASEDDLQTSVIKIINYLFLFLGLALLVIIIYSGVKIIFSDGDEEAVTGARTTIMYAILGVAVIVLSYTLVDFIANVATGGGNE